MYVILSVIYAEFRVLNDMLSFVVLSVVVLSVIMLSVVMLSVFGA